MAAHTGANSLRFEDTDKPHVLSCGSLCCEIFAIPGKSYREECPKWEKLPGSSSEGRAARASDASSPTQRHFVQNREHDILMSLNTTNPHPTT